MMAVRRSRPRPTRDRQTSSNELLLDRLREAAATGESIDLAPGVVIRDTYRLYRFLGRGGMGEVWQAVDMIREAGDASEADVYVALKFLSPEVRNHPYALKALVREFSRYRRLIHPNIVRAYELNRDADRIYLVLEYLEGGSLREWIRAHPQGTPLDEAEPIIRGMCAGLAHAHRQGILHMDFKPSNVFYDPQTRVTKVIDFGIARLSDPKEREKTRFDPGQLQALSEVYASPEMLANAEPDRRDDIYGLGCVCYELLSGHHPFDRLNALAASHQGLTPKPIPGLTEAQNEIIARALAFQREERLADPRQLYEGLYGRPLEAARVSPVRPVLRIPAWLKWAGIAGILATALLWGGEAWRRHAFERALLTAEPEAVAAFLEAEPGHQLRWLGNPAVRLSLVRYWISRDGHDPFRILATLPGATREVFLGDRAVRGLLIGHVLKVAARLQEGGDWQGAGRILHQALRYYPDSGSLNAAAATLQVRIRKQLRIQETRYERCLRHPELGCFEAVRTALAGLDPDHPLLQDDRLARWLRAETGRRLRHGELEEAQALLDRWQAWYPHDDTIVELRSQLHRKREVATWRARLAGDALPEALAGFRSLDDRLRAEILQDRKTVERIWKHYLARMAVLQQAGRFPEALALLEEARTVMQAEQRGTLRWAVRQKARELERARARREAALVRALRQRFQQGEPDVAAIRELQRQLAVVSPDHPALAYPDLPRYFPGRIERALKQGTLEKAATLLAVWQQLRPDDVKKSRYQALRHAYQEAVRLAERRRQWQQRIEAAIGKNDDALLAQLLAALPATVRDTVLGHEEERLTAYYRSRLTRLLQENDFDRARAVLRQAGRYLPAPRQVALSRRFDQARDRRVAELARAFADALAAEPPRYRIALSSLGDMARLAPEATAVSQALARLQRHALETVQSEPAYLTRLGELFAVWQVSAQADAAVAEALRRTKNLVALQLLLKGRELAAMGESRKALETYRFALALEPVATVRRRLQRSLREMTSPVPPDAR